MNMIKRLISIVILFTFLSSCPMIQTQAAIAENLAQQYELLVKLNFFKDTQTNGEMPMTKGEFISAIMSAIPDRKKTVYHGGETGFSDVSSNNAYAKVVYEAKMYGILNVADGEKLNVDSYLTYRDATEILINLLGYKEFAQLNGYAAAMSRSGIGKGYTVKNANCLTKNDVISLLYTLLDTGMLIRTVYGNVNQFEVSRDKTFLTEVLGVKKGEGIVQDNSYTGLTSPSTLRKDTVNIGGVVFETADSGADKLLGYYVNYYYREDITKDELILIYVHKSSRNTELVLTTDEIIGYKNYEYIYCKTGGSKVESASVSRAANFIYNGETIEVPFDRYVPKNGKVTLVDNDGNGSFDVILIYEYETVVVGDIIRTESKVTDMFGLTDIYTFDQNDHSVRSRIEDENGKFVDFFSLKKWDVLSVAASQDGKVVTGILCRNSVSGKVEEIEADAVTIDGRRYYFNTDRICTAGNGNSYGKTVVEPNDVGCFYLDIFGKIQAVDKQMMASSQVGYLFKAAVTGAFADRLQLKVFTQQGTFVEYDCANRVTVNDVTYDNPGLAYNRLLTTDGSVQQLISYTLNSKGEVCRIDLAAPYSDALEIPSGFREDIPPKSQLNHYEDCFSNKVRPVDGKTKIFVIPEDRNDESMYFFTNSHYFAYDRTYTISAYSVTDGIPYSEYIVVYLGGGEKNFESYDMDLLVVEKVLNALDQEGEETKKLIGMQGYNEVTYLISGKSRAASQEFHPGDILRIRKDRNGHIEDVEQMFDGKNMKHVGTDPLSVDPTSQSRHLFGNVYYKMGTTLMVTVKPPEQVTKRSELEYVFGDAYNYVLRFDTASKKVTRGSFSQVKEYKLYPNDYTKVFAYTRYSDPQLLVIFE